MAVDVQSVTANWNYPTQIRFGPGRIRELPEVCAAFGIHRPLIVTDPGLAELAFVVEAVRSCRDAGLVVEVFFRIKPNPVGRNVEDGVAVYHAGAHDGMICLGGGSAMDAGKAIAFMAAQSLPIWRFEDKGDNWKAASSAIAPIIAIPTTSGTGSEVGRASVILDEDVHTKKIIFHPQMMPAMVIADPELTVALPPTITAWTGMDALAHCLEAYCAPGFHPMADGIAAEGIRLTKEWLPVAVADGTDIAARANMMVAASMGATAFQKGLGAIHSLSHPVGAFYDTHHGLTNAVFMPYVLAFNRAAISERMVRLAAWLGLQDPGFDAIMSWVLDLRSTIGIPHTLAGLGVDAQREEAICAMALEDPTAPSNPVTLDFDGARSIFRNALNGVV